MTAPADASVRGATRATRSVTLGRDVLVVGSYPPVPTAGAAVTVALVRDLWAEGARPHVVAPRASAAPLTVAVAGLLAGRRLDNLRLVTGATDVVLCAERDLPIPTGGFPDPVRRIVQRLTAAQVGAALAAFGHVTLIACGDHGIPPEIWARMASAADTVIDRSEVRGAPGVTALGPSGPLGSRLVARAARLAPRVFGRHTPHVRRAVTGGIRLARRWDTRD